MRLNPYKNIIPFMPRHKGLRGLNGDILGTAAKLAAAYYTGGASSAAGALVGGGGGGASGGAGAPGASGPITVNPAIQTTVSPQISPVFQQSYMPQNSGMTAGTTQTAPNVQSATSGRPQAPDYGYPVGNSPLLPVGYTGLDASGYPISNLNPVTQIPAQNTLTKYLPYILGAVALIGVAYLIKSSRK